MNRTCSSPTLLLALFAISLPAASFGQAVHSLRAYQQKPGEVVRITTRSLSPNGTTTITEGGVETKGKMTFQRERNLERTVTAQGGHSVIHYKIVSDVTKTSVDFDGKPKPNMTVSSLTGKTISGSQDAQGIWRFSLPGAKPTASQATEIAQFDAAENKTLFPAQPVRLKQSWPINPEFIAQMTERGIGLANVTATARLDQVKEIDGEETALITLTVETIATEGTKAEGGSGSIVQASGELHVSMKTMLDKKLVLYGSRRNVSVKAGTTTRTHLPFRLEVTKTRGK